MTAGIGRTVCVDAAQEILLQAKVIESRYHGHRLRGLKNEFLRTSLGQRACYTRAFDSRRRQR